MRQEKPAGNFLPAASQSVVKAQVKSNVFHIDGTDLSRCCLLEVHPEPFILKEGSQVLTCLTHTDANNDRLSTYLREIIFRLFVERGGREQGGRVTIHETLWRRVADAYGFQSENVYNQLEDVTHAILVMVMRELDSSEEATRRSSIATPLDRRWPPLIGAEALEAVVEEYHAKLFDNYYKWCDYVGLNPFPWGPGKLSPWGSLPSEKDATSVSMVCEIILFRLIWGEAANLRHTPELLCFLFHWAIRHWVHAGFGSAAAARNQLDQPPSIAFLDAVTAFVQRIKDEAWYGSTLLKPPDHSERLNYDDFNELFWNADAWHWVERKNAPLRPSSVTELLTYLTRSQSAEGGSIKTFVERRSYAQVARAYYRVFHWHFFALQWLILLRHIYTAELPEVINRQWGVTMVVGIALSAAKPILELLLYDFKQLKKLRPWGQLMREAGVDLVRLAILVFAVLILAISEEGLCSSFFRPTGLVGIIYLSFYAATAVWQLLHVRIFGTMPFFMLIWHVPGIRWLLGPHVYTGCAALLAEDLSHVLGYTAFWLLILACKAAFWFFGILPVAVQGARVLDMVGLRPLTLYDIAILQDSGGVVLTALYWTPFYVLWLMDTQIFFLLIGSLVGTFVGYLRRVGYVQDIFTIQTQLLPLIPAAPLLSPDVGAISWRSSAASQHDDHPACNLKRTVATAPPSQAAPLSFGVTPQRPVRGGSIHSQTQSISRRPARNFSHVFTGRTPRQGGGLGSLLTPLSRDQRSVRVTYANISDPYILLSQAMRGAGEPSVDPIPGLSDTAQDVRLSDSCGTRVKITLAHRYRKCFGFVWNEVCNSWRLTDVINNNELAKLQFNELPLFCTEGGTVRRPDSEERQRAAPSPGAALLGLTSWSDLQWGGGGHDLCSVVWEKSEVRLPPYVYADLISGFLTTCENYQLQQQEKYTRILWREKLAEMFYRRNLSRDDAGELGARALKRQTLLPLDGIAEVVQAFCMYLSRYLAPGGALLARQIERVWLWVADEPSRLTFFNLLKLREIRNVLTELFATIEKGAGAGIGNAASPEERRRNLFDLIHRRLRKALEDLIVATPGVEGSLPPILDHSLALIHTCFTAPFTLPPSCEPPRTTASEVNNLLLRLQQLSGRDAAAVLGGGLGDPLQAVSKDPVVGFATSRGPPSPPLERIRVMELRTLYRLENGAWLPRDLDGALRLYFRRAAHVMSVTEARLGTPEAQRRVKFFVTSLLMRMPVAPPVVQMVSMSTLTPHYREECVVDLEDFQRPTEARLTKTELLRSLMPEMFANFLERVDSMNEMFSVHAKVEAAAEARAPNQCEMLRAILKDLGTRAQIPQYLRFCRELQSWLSNHSQVLSRTVRGMLYYETSLQILAYIESRRYEKLHLSHDLNRLNADQRRVFFSADAALYREVLQLPPPHHFHPFVKSTARLKYSYVVACQEFGNDRLLCRATGEAKATPEAKAARLRAAALTEMLRQNLNLRIATIEDEVDPLSQTPTGRKMSVLYRWCPKLYAAALKPAGPQLPKLSPGSSQSPDTPLSATTDSASDGVLSTAPTDVSTDELGRGREERAWFHTEAQQQMSPPRSPEDFRKTIELFDEQLSSSAATSSPLHSGWQSPLRHRPGSPVVPLDPKTPGSLEAGPWTPPSTKQSSSASHMSRRWQTKLTSPCRPRFFGVLPHVAAETITATASMSAEDDEFIATPLLGRDNDLLLAASLEAPAERLIQDVAAHEAVAPGPPPPTLHLNLGPSAANSQRPTSAYPPVTTSLLEGDLQRVYSVLLPSVKDASRGKPWPRNPIIGQGKPENQNHAIIFTRGETIQAIDMNMDGYLEEALKLRNVLQEFTASPRMRILGFREHIFSLDVSSISSYMALQELAFVTTNQRLYDKPLCVRMHYGHPDIFDRFFVMNCGSMSKASNGINLSEDVFAGYNVTQRGCSVQQVDYHQVGKGRDVGLAQIFTFEKKVAGGNAEQMLSRDVRRIMDHTDFFRAMSIFYSGSGFFLSTLILMLAVFTVLYGKVFLSFARNTSPSAIGQYWVDVLAPTTNIQLQLGMLLILPVVLLICLETGLLRGVHVLITMIVKFALFYYNFMVCTKASTIDGVLIYGGAKYLETGRGFQIAHSDLRSTWRLYYFTHFQIAIELLLLLVLYAGFGGLGFLVYCLDTWPLWILFASFAWTPFMFNPLGAEYSLALSDIVGFFSWLNAKDVESPEGSWRAWWRQEMDRRAEMWWHSRVLLVFRLLRFFALSFGLTTLIAQYYDHSDVDTFVYLVAAFLTVEILLVFMSEFHVVSPAVNKFLGFVLVMGCISILAYLASTDSLPFGVFLTCVLAFVVLVYWATRFALAVTGRYGVRHPFNEYTMRVFHAIFACVIFFPVLLIASLTTSFHLVQTRILFNSRFVQMVESGLIKKAAAEKRGEKRD